MIKIITDSSSNVSQEEAKKLSVTVMPLTIMFGAEEFRDGIDIDGDAFYEKLTSSKEFPHTAQLAEEQIEAAVKAAKEEADEVLIMPIASALSGSYERCKAVAAKYQNVYAYDTKCTTLMLKMLVLEALANAEKPAAEVIKILDGFRPKIKLYAALDTLEYLCKGGRLSKATAFLGTLLKIKPVIEITGEGKVELISKQFGINKGISYVAQKADLKKIDFTKPVYMLYTWHDKNCQTLISKLGVENYEKCNICPVIGAHNGPEGAGIVFAEK